MENHLKTHDFFAAGQLTIADIALYAYTHVADKCDFDLTTFPSILTWLRRVERQPGFTRMDGSATPTGNAAAGIAAGT
jgi:glutathione S-transferase